MRKNNLKVFSIRFVILIYAALQFSIVIYRNLQHHDGLSILVIFLLSLAIAFVYEINLNALSGYKFHQTDLCIYKIWSTNVRDE